MSGGVWMSDVLAPRGLGNKQGSRTKYFGTDWNPEDFVLPVPPPQVMESLYRYLQGYRLERPEFPEAEAVWNEGSFNKRKDLFFSGPFFVVQGVLADLFYRFNFGDGGLIPITIFKSDLMTPYPGEF